jgi:cytochrome c oxidase assembly protein subunit 15
MPNSKSSKAVSIWLFIGCVMVLIQILIGGITRLTDSGLSITEWEIIKGTLPPLNEVEWQIAFDKYKLFAKKQYESIHIEMNMTAFKRIYFWEYFHRLWARLMGFVFAIPFFYFLIRKKIGSVIIRRLCIVIFLASLSATFGWLMVASGLSDDKRTWVNAYNLLIHLILATSLFSYLLYTYYQYAFDSMKERVELVDREIFKLIGVVLIIQLGFGALMAGMKAALVFPYPFILVKWPLFQEIWSTSPAIQWAHWNDYEPNQNVKLIVQIVHRVTAYFLLLASIWFFFVNRVKMFIVPSYLIYYIVLLVQICLGILTVTYSKGQIPIVLGVLHQFIAFILLASYLWILYSSKKRR